MHEIMTGEKYVQPKIDEKKGKKEKATLKEVKEEDEGEAEEMENAKKKEKVEDTTQQTQGKWSEVFNCISSFAHADFPFVKGSLPSLATKRFVKDDAVSALV